MTERQLLRQLKKESKIIVPDNRGNILAVTGVEDRKENKSGEVFKKNFWRWLVPAAGAVCGMLLLMFFLLPPIQSGMIFTNAVVVIDINPVFEIKADNTEKVTAVRGLNKQAVRLLNGQENIYLGKKLYTVTEEVTELVINGGYIKEEVRVSAACENNNYEKYIEGKSVAAVEKILQSKNVSARVNIPAVPDNAADLAKKHKTTERKISICLELLKKDNSLRLEALLEEDMDDLLEMRYDYNSKNVGKFQQDFLKNKEKTESEKNKLLNRLESMKEAIDKEYESIFALITAKPYNFVKINNALKDLRAYYNEEIFDGEVTDANIEEFAEEMSELKEELDEDVEEARCEIAESYAEWLEEYEQLLKEGVDSDEGFDLEDLEFDFELDLDIKLSGKK